ncbi:MAG: leucine-rich repeat protein [Candidatus Symbiothrix sp.]|jgi:hypothetical protein|nr:leucine-rich repeat protein [Candidatus Symbiothrix sp.]
MKKTVFYLMMLLLLPWVAANVNAQGDDITLTIELNTQTVIDPQYSGTTTNPGEPTIPDYYVNIHAAIEAAGTQNSLDLAEEGTDVNRVKHVILTGSAEYTYFDLRGVRVRFPAITTVDMSATKLKNNKIQSPFGWKRDWSATGGNHTLNGEYGYIETAEADVISGAFAFPSSTSEITTVYLPNTLVSIGAFAFANCRYLTNLTLPESLNSIETEAFVNCAALTIPAGLPSSMNGALSRGVFDQCGNLELTTLPSNLAITGDATFIFRNTKVSFTEINGKINGNDTKRRYWKGVFSDSRVAIKEIPEGIYTIGEEVFQNCSEIDTITFPLTMGMSISGQIQSEILNNAFALPEGSPVNRVYIFKSETPPTSTVVASAFYKGSGLDPTAIVLVPNNDAVAAFKAKAPFDEMNVYRISNTVTVSGGGAIATTDYYYDDDISDGNIHVMHGHDITLTLSANCGGDISGVLVNSVPTSLDEEGSLTLTNVTGDITVEVTTTANSDACITLNPETDGTIAVSGATLCQNNVYATSAGNELTLTFTPKAGFDISRVLVDDQEVTLDENTYILTVTGNHTVSVEYTRNSFEIVIADVADGSISHDYDGNLAAVPRGTNITFTFTPSAGGAYIWRALVNGASVTLDENNRYVISNIKANYTISAEFSPAPDRTIHVSPSGDNSNGNSWATAYKTIADANLSITAGQNVLIVLEKGVTITETSTTQSANGIINFNDANVTIEGNHAIIKAGSDTGTGRRIFRFGNTSKTLRIKDLTLQDKTLSADGTGGAIYFAGVLLDIENCTFANNKAGFGSAITSRGKDVIIKNSVFKNNTNIRTLDATGTGVITHTGLATAGGGSLVIDGCVFANNTTTQSINGSVITTAKENSSQNYYLNNVSITNSTFFQNGKSGLSTEPNAAICLGAPSPSAPVTTTVLANNTFYQNYTGAIYSASNKYNITLVNNAIVGNLSESTDIGINSASAQTVTANNNTIVAQTPAGTNITLNGSDNSLADTQADIDNLYLDATLSTTPEGIITHLAINDANSLLVNAGANTFPGITLPAFDAIGTSRANGVTTGKKYDIGAFEYVFRPSVFVWNGAASSAWTSTANWQDALIPEATDRVLIPSSTIEPVIPTGTTLKTLTIEQGAGARLDGTLNVTDTLKATYTIAGEKWYAIGFPFTINTVYSHYFAANNWIAELIPYTAGNNGDYYLRSVNGEDFIPESTYSGGAAIAQFPYWHTDEQISFIATSPVTLNSAEFATNLSSGSNYQLVSNPSLGEITLSAADAASYYYVLNAAGTAFQQITEDTPLKAFESVITLSKAIAGAPAHIDITDEITSINARPENDRLVATQYYNLQGVRIGNNKGLQSLATGVYIVKQIHESGKTSVSKSIIR